MAETPPEVKSDPPIERVAEMRLPDPMTQSEREVFEGKIETLQEENADLKKRLGEKETPPESPKKKKNWFDDWLP